jgi:hypothetical protein
VGTADFGSSTESLPADETHPNDQGVPNPNHADQPHVPAHANSEFGSGAPPLRRSSLLDSISESEETPSDEDLPPPLNPDFPILGEEAGYEEDECEAVVVEEEIPICAILDGLDPFPA